jgi:hypothetical protein
VLKDRLISKAINYTLNQWDNIDGGSTPLSDILAENAIRKFCVGRRNGLLGHTPSGAKASSPYYSLIETAKAMEAPYDHMAQMLAKLPYADTVDRFEALLPRNFKNEMEYFPIQR